LDNIGEGSAGRSRERGAVLGRAAESALVGTSMTLINGERRVLTTGNFKEMPKIVCLCGSTRFYEHFQQWNYRFTMDGWIVLSVGFYPHSQLVAHGEKTGCTAKQKLALDELHKRKIDLADEVFVLNVGGYIGESTRSEIEYAEHLLMPVRYLEERSGALLFCRACLSTSL
jgi:hypothetical protein